MGLLHIIIHNTIFSLSLSIHLHKDCYEDKTFTLLHLFLFDIIFDLVNNEDDDVVQLNLGTFMQIRILAKFYPNEVTWEARKFPYTNLSARLVAEKIISDEASFFISISACQVR